MPMIAVIGAGPLGGALAHALARRNRVGDVRLIDPDVTVAQGKALDILQSALSNVRTRRARGRQSMPPRRAPTRSCWPTTSRAERSLGKQGLR